MTGTVDKNLANKALTVAFVSKSLPLFNEISSKIDYVLSGTHKTYKYILLTGLLAKTVNEKINPLALQARANIDGAYDARSVCHDIIVPFERTFLAKALGGSNEPFLNKPARFTHLSLENAVRRGNDKKTLELLIEVLKSIRTSNEAMIYLTHAVQYLKAKKDELRVLAEKLEKHSPTLVEIYSFLEKFIEKSHEGETCAIIVATIETLYYKSISENYRVESHKVNQSGASSKEIADIDVFKNDIFKYGIEVKDKSFTVYDLEHAFNKIFDNNGQIAAFIYGPRATFNEDEIYDRLEKYAQEGRYTFFDSIESYSRSALLRTDIDDKEGFFNILLDVSIKINAKETTKKWVMETLNYLQMK